MTFKQYIYPDVCKWGGRRHLKFIPQFRFLYFKRKCEYWRPKNKLIFCFYRFIYEKYKTKYLTDIPAQAVIGKGFKIEHVGGIVINPSVKIGNDVTILNNVLIGMEKRGKRRGNPVIGNKVYIASGVVIVGKISVGNNVLIAANSFVNFDVPDNSIVVGNKIIHNDHATDGYIL